MDKAADTTYQTTISFSIGVNILCSSSIECPFALRDSVGVAMKTADLSD